MIKSTLIYVALFFSSAEASLPTIRGAKDDKKDSRSLLTAPTKVTGECTVDNFLAAVQNNQATLAQILGVENDIPSIEIALEDSCASAREGTLDLSDAVGKGPQFLKNFLDGGTFWNEYTDTTGVYSLEDSASQVQQVSSVITETVLSAPDGGANAKYPNYFSNFYNDGEKCRLWAITCCYTASRSPGTTLAGNSDMCAHDMYLSAQSNHIHKKSYTIYDPQGTNNAYCSGFAWDEGSFADDVKYNTLYKMAIGENLFEHDRVRNIPGAPMCGCAEQMPIIPTLHVLRLLKGTCSIRTDQLQQI